MLPLVFFKQSAERAVLQGVCLRQGVLHALLALGRVCNMQGAVPNRGHLYPVIKRYRLHSVSSF